MDKEKIFTEVENDNYISGIYNYCDRWCERCTFSTQCMSYRLEQEENEEYESRFMENQQFWNKLSETFKLTKELLHEAAAEQNINLDDLDTTNGDQIHEKSHAYAEGHPLAKIARKYSNIVSGWFSEASHLFTMNFDEHNKSLTINPVNPTANINIDEIEDAISVIRWYQFQISVKLMRALNGVIMEEGDELWRDERRDSDGSAKVSLLGIDHSLAAWGCLLNSYPTEENTILDMLVLLEKLRKDIEKEFPNARAFIRPGFDE